MSEHMEKAIGELQDKLKPIEAEANKLKITINQLCEVAGKPPIYKIESDEEKSQSLSSIKSDEFYGKALARSVRQVLELRKRSGMDPPATAREIYEALLSGGYHFETKNEANALRSLRISLTKNVAVFHKLPNGKFGLVSWYPKVKASKQTANSPESEVKGADDVGDDDDSDDVELQENEEN